MCPAFQQSIFVHKQNIHVTELIHSLYHLLAGVQGWGQVWEVWSNFSPLPPPALNQNYFIKSQRRSWNFMFTPFLPFEQSNTHDPSLLGFYTVQSNLNSLNTDGTFTIANCPPPFRRKARGHSIRLSMVRGSEFIVGTLWAQLLQFLTNPSEILQVSLS